MVVSGAFAGRNIAEKMAYWLLKTEPGVYSFDQLECDGTTRWEGVSNNLALKHLRAMKPHDQAFIYHSGAEKAIVGIAEIVSLPYPDPGLRNEKLVVVDLKPKSRLMKKVALGELKTREQFASFDLLRIPRLSVMPVSQTIWEACMEIANQHHKAL